MKMPYFFLLRSLFFFFAATCLLFASVRADDSPRDLKVGFFLLRDVCDDESRVGMITLVKTTPDDVADYVKRLSQRAGDDLKAIDEMEARDETLKLETNPLPMFEQTVRNAIEADKEHQLLFGTKGAAFARALLVTQIEASNYIVQMAKVLADEDPSARDTRTLLKISSHWVVLRDEAFRLLAR